MTTCTYMSVAGCDIQVGDLILFQPPCIVFNVIMHHPYPGRRAISVETNRGEYMFPGSVRYEVLRIE